MAVVYVPAKQDFGTALGEGVGQGLSTFATKEMDRQQQLQEAQTQLNAVNRIRTAKSREEAYAILNEPGVVKTPIQLHNAMQFVQGLFPAKDRTPQIIEGFDSSGQPTKRVILKGEETKLNDQAFQEQLFGKGGGLTKPEEKVPVYTESPEGTPKFKGRVPISQRQPGDMTIQELELAAKQRSEKRSQATQERAATTQERLAKAAEEKNRMDEIRVQDTARKAWADALNVKKTIGADGQIFLDFEGDPQKQHQYIEGLKKLDTALTKNKGNLLKSVTQVADEMGVGAVKDNSKDTPKAEPAKAPKKSGGLISRLIKSASEKKPAQAEAKGKVDEAPRDPAKRVAGKVYSTPKGNLRWTGTRWVEE